MKDIYKNAMITGLVGALLILCLFAITSFIANEDIKNYQTMPHDYMSDDVGFFWYLLFFGASPFIVIGSGLMSTFLLRRQISSEKEAVIVATIASVEPCIICTAAIVGYRLISTSVGNILPYYEPDADQPVRADAGLPGVPGIRRGHIRRQRLRSLQDTGLEDGSTTKLNELRPFLNDHPCILLSRSICDV